MEIPPPENRTPESAIALVTKVWSDDLTEWDNLGNFTRDLAESMEEIAIGELFEWDFALELLGQETIAGAIALIYERGFGNALWEWLGVIDGPEEDE